MAEIRDVIFNVEARGGESVRELTNDLGVFESTLGSTSQAVGECSEMFQGIILESYTLADLSKELDEAFGLVKTGVQTTAESGMDYVHVIETMEGDIHKLTEKLQKQDAGSSEYAGTLQELTSKQWLLTMAMKEGGEEMVTLKKQMDNIASVGNSIMSGFTALSASVTLFGGESKTLDNILGKLGVTFELVKGVKGLAGLQTSIPALIKGFGALTASAGAMRKVMISTGIGALVLVVGAVIANFDKLTGEYQRNQRQTETLTKSYNAYQESISALQKEQDLEMRTMQATGATELEMVYARRDHAAALMEQTRAEIEHFKSFKKLNGEQQELLDNLEQQLVTYRSSWEAALTDEVLVFRKAAYEKQQAEKAAEEERLAEQKRIAKEKAIQQEEQRKQDLENIKLINQEIAEAGMDAAALELERLRENYNEQLQLFERRKDEIEDYDKAVENLTLKYYEDVDKIVQEEEQRLSAEAVARRQAELDLIKENNEQLLSEQQLAYARLEEERLQQELNGDKESLEEVQQRIEEARLAEEEAAIEFMQNYKLKLEEILLDETIIGEDRLKIQKEIQQLSNDIVLAGVNNEINALKKQKEEEAKILEGRKKAKEAFYSVSASLLSEASNLVGKETAAGKTMAIASATMSTYEAAQKAYNSMAGIPIVGPALGAAAAAAAVMSGINNIKSIASVSVPGESSGGSAVAAVPSAPSVAAMAQQVETLQPDVNQLYPEIDKNYSQLTSTEERSINTRVYVLESDISDTIRRVNVAENESSF